MKLLNVSENQYTSLYKKLITVLRTIKLAELDFKSYSYSKKKILEAMYKSLNISIDDLANNLDISKASVRWHINSIQATNICNHMGHAQNLFHKRKATEILLLIKT